jgi:hypothetical protein
VLAPRDQIAIDETALYQWPNLLAAHADRRQAVVDVDMKQPEYPVQASDNHSVFREQLDIDAVHVVLVKL